MQIHTHIVILFILVTGACSPWFPPSYLQKKMDFVKLGVGSTVCLFTVRNCVQSFEVGVLGQVLMI